MVPFADLRRHARSIRAQIDASLDAVLESGVLILGEQVQAFEDEFARACGVTHGIGVGSGTDALHLALVGAGVRPGDEVVTVANAGVPTIAAIEMARAQPVLVDIDPVTFTIDPSKIEARLTSRT